MKINIQLIILLSLALSAFAVGNARSNPYDGKVNIQKNKLRAKNDTIEVDLRFYLDSLRVPSKSTLTLVPVIRSSSEMLILPEIWVNGNNRQKVYERRKKLGTKMQPYSDAYVIVSTQETSSKHVDYLVKVPQELCIFNRLESENEQRWF